MVQRPVIEVKKEPIHAHRTTPHASVVPPPEQTAPTGFDAQVFAFANANDCGLRCHFRGIAAR
jgi:hypothetical protein